MKLLIVDDEKLIRDVIKTYAETENFEALEAENGLEALDVLKKENRIYFDWNEKNWKIK